jgi:hypothetical protein
MIRAQKSKIQIRLSPPNAPEGMPTIGADVGDAPVLAPRSPAVAAITIACSAPRRLAAGRKSAARRSLPALWARDLDLRSQSWDGVREGLA